MNSLLKQYKMRCEEVVSKYSFRRKKNVFARVVNDVLQSFYIEKLSTYQLQRQCRIGFSILPLGQKLEAKWVYNGIGLYDLKSFNYDEQDDRWLYKNTPKDIEVCVEEILAYINKYLLPFFERSKNCETALPELIALEKLFNENRKEFLKNSGMKDEAGPEAELNLLDSAKYYIALKNRDFDFALKCRKALLEQNIDSYQSLQEYDYLTEKTSHERKESIKELQDEIRYLEEQNWDYFKTIITAHEAYSREQLKDLIY